MNTSNNYSELKKPSWAPPGRLFGPVWMVLYIIIFVSFGYVIYLYFRNIIPFYFTYTKLKLNRIILNSILFFSIFKIHTILPVFSWLIKIFLFKKYCLNIWKGIYTHALCFWNGCLRPGGTCYLPRAYRITNWEKRIDERYRKGAGTYVWWHSIQGFWTGKSRRTGSICRCSGLERANERIPPYPDLSWFPHHDGTFR